MDNKNLSLDNNLSDVPGLGPVLVESLRSISLNSIRDLLYYVPRRYEDYSNLLKINQLNPGLVSLKLTINQLSTKYVRRGLHITEALASDETGTVRLVWFNQPYRAKSIKKSEPYFVSGKFELSSSRFAIMNPAMELVSDFPISTNRIIPVYRIGKNISMRQIRHAIRAVFKNNVIIDETLPSSIVVREKIISLKDALYSIHFPENILALDKARYRLGFEEVFALSLASSKNKDILKASHSKIIEFDVDLAKRFVGSLPFKLTDSQRKIIWQIYLDLAKDLPMNRLVEGDVGSGKTVVALMSSLMVVKGGWQVVFMAPTEVLARQHFNTITNLLQALNLSNKVALLVGSQSAKQKSQIKKQILDKELLIIVGTHALLENDVVIDSLALVIVDEQHRFGVKQRKILQLKSGSMPHLLSLSATPIPRSLALTLFGELSISRLIEKPKQRLPIVTKIVVDNDLDQVYKQMQSEMDQGRQIFVVCPLITESESYKRSDVDSVYKKLSTEIFSKNNLGYLHGKMKANEKNDVMNDFINKKLDLIVSTTVIEVGVDVPNATIMLIYNADHFGLAQIHQLRGRVGRGKNQGYCFLTGDKTILKNERIQQLETLDDGFKLAEVDLRLRGPGALYGISQHGALDLRFADLNDTQLILKARKSADDFIDSKESLLEYRELNNKVNYLSRISSLN